jgi:dTDP-4-amino-4,6-dideoxygalactose transaminase
MIAATEFVPYNRPMIGQEEIDEVVATLRSGWLTTGPRTEQFEREFRNYIGAPYSLATNSCTAALHLALVALGIGPGDEVITTPLTFCATVNTILQAGATPVLADVKQDGNIDVASVRDRITLRTRAVIPVHFGGWPCDMDALWRLARQWGLAVIEDAAHAAGTQYDNRYIGAGDSKSEYRSDAVCFSFYATKNLTTGEGGMVTTHSESLLEKMRILCLHGISKDAWNRYGSAGRWFYEVTACGYKYNLSDIQAAIGIHQLRKLEHFIAARADVANFYNEQFAGMDEIIVPQDSTEQRHAWHLYVLKLNLQKLSISREIFIEELRKRGVGTSVHFIPIPLHPFYRQFDSLSAVNCPTAMSLYPRLVSLPLYPGMTELEIRTVVRSVQEIVRTNKVVRPVAVGAVSNLG